MIDPRPGKNETSVQKVSEVTSIKMENRPGLEEMSERERDEVIYDTGDIEHHAFCVIETASQMIPDLPSPYSPFLLPLLK